MVGNFKLKNLKTTLFILFGCVMMSSICKGQYIAHYITKDHIKTDTLIDKQTGTRFVIDKKRITVKAISHSGKVLWITDPSVDNKIPEYRQKRPVIVYFAFGTDRTKDKKEVIAISYSNSQFGYLDKKTGKFHFIGQD